MKELKRKKEIAKKEEEMLNELVKIVFDPEVHQTS